MLLGSTKIVVATPKCLWYIENDLEDIVCIEISNSFSCIDKWYTSFPQACDQEVLGLYKKHQPIIKNEIQML